MYFFHCCCCSSPLCDLLSTPPSCARLFSLKHQSVNYLFSFFLKPLLVYDLSITVVLLFKFFFFHVLLREHGFPCVFLNALLKHFENCSHTLCNSQWSKATWGGFRGFSNKLSSRYIWFVFVLNLSVITCTLVFSQDYKSLFEGAGTNPGEKTLEDKFFEHEVCKEIRT